MTTYQLNGTLVTPTVTTTPAILDMPRGCNGVIIVNPSTANTLYVHLVPQGATAPSAAEVLRGLRVYPNGQISLSILNEAPYGCDIYVSMSASTQQINAYGVI